MSFWDKYFGLCTNINSNANAEAKKIGIASSTVSNWKTKGGRPQPHTLKKIAEHFGVSEEYFSDEAPEAEKSPGQMTEAELDNELIEIWKSGDEDEHRALLEMARLIKSRRETK